VQAGVAYSAPSNDHLLVETGRTLALSADGLVVHARPSIDVLFESAAEAYGPALVGVILTGANEDGAAGLSSICRAGGVALQLSFCFKVRALSDRLVSSTPE
jgi:two-component system, chemotaxis family, protein-glutamate methylesterase/glutaminase